MGYGPVYFRGTSPDAIDVGSILFFSSREQVLATRNAYNQIYLEVPVPNLT